jgi:hypothetical protein
MGSATALQRLNTYPLAVEFEVATPDALVVAIFMTGERIPVIRLKLLARASPVPRCGAGKTFEMAMW